MRPSSSVTLLLLYFHYFIKNPQRKVLKKFNTLLKGKHYVAKGWEKAGVTGVVKGESALPPEDPFEEIGNVLQL